MEQQKNDFEKYQKAQKQVQEIKAFYSHLLSFIAVMIFLLFINLKYSPNHLWFYWPLLGWGIGLVFHGLRAFNYAPFFSKDWEERKIQQYMNQQNNDKTKYE